MSQLLIPTYGEIDFPMTSWNKYYQQSLSFLIDNFEWIVCFFAGKLYNVKLCISVNDKNTQMGPICSRPTETIRLSETNATPWLGLHIEPYGVKS